VEPASVSKVPTSASPAHDSAVAPVALAPDDTTQPIDLRFDPSASEWVRAPRQARSEETLMRFLEATAVLLTERTFDQISVNDIVERADRTVGSFYARFDDKASVLRVLVEQTGARLRNDAHNFWSVDNWRGRPMAEIISGTVDAVLNAYREAGPVFHAAAILAPGDDSFRAVRLGVWVVCAERFAEVLADRADEIGHPDPERAAELAMTSMIALADLRLIYGTGLRPAYDDDEALRADLVALVTALVDPRS
jgi:AcrR family transcriptional regulator